MFFDWAFDGNIKSPIPQREGVDLLKYNSPIHATFLLKSFVNNAKLNHYLNQYLNNIGVRYIEKEDLFYFIKQCIIDFKVNRRSIHYIQWSSQDALFNKMSQKFPLLKRDELSIACEIIEKSDERDAIYRSFGIDKTKYEKKKIKNKVEEKISSKNFIAKNFSMV